MLGNATLMQSACHIYFNDFGQKVQGFITNLIQIKMFQRPHRINTRIVTGCVKPCEVLKMVLTQKRFWSLVQFATKKGEKWLFWKGHGNTDPTVQ